MPPSCTLGLSTTIINGNVYVVCRDDRTNLYNLLLRTEKEGDRVILATSQNPSAIMSLNLVELFDLMLDGVESRFVKRNLDQSFSIEIPGQLAIRVTAEQLSSFQRTGGQAFIQAMTMNGRSIPITEISEGFSNPTDPDGGLTVAEMIGEHSKVFSQ